MNGCRISRRRWVVRTGGVVWARGGCHHRRRNTGIIEADHGRVISQFFAISLASVSPRHGRRPTRSSSLRTFPSSQGSLLLKHSGQR